MTGQGVLPRAVHRIDDPHPVGFQPLQVIVSFLTEHRITGSFGPQPTLQQGVGSAVTLVTE